MKAGISRWAAVEVLTGGVKRRAAYVSGTRFINSLSFGLYSYRARPGRESSASVETPLRTPARTDNCGSRSTSPQQR